MSPFMTARPSLRPLPGPRQATYKNILLGQQLRTDVSNCDRDLFFLLVTRKSWLVPAPGAFHGIERKFEEAIGAEPAGFLIVTLALPGKRPIERIMDDQVNGGRAPVNAM